MVGLAELQREFADYLRKGEPAIAEQVMATERVDTTTRLGIYAEAYRLRLVDALASDYPGLRVALGADGFAALGHDYIDAYPSVYYTLRHFGKDVSRFLRESPRFVDRPWLVELADFEWLLAAAFDAADATPYTLDDANALSPESWPSLRLCFQPAVQRLNLVWNVAPFWQAVSDEAKLPAWQRSEQPVPWLIWRKQLRVFFRSMDEVERIAFDAARAGEDFSGLCIALCEALPEDEVPLRAAALLRSWIAEAMLSGVEIDSVASDSDESIHPV